MAPRPRAERTLVSLLEHSSWTMPLSRRRGPPVSRKCTWSAPLCRVACLVGEPSTPARAKVYASELASLAKRSADASFGLPGAGLLTESQSLHVGPCTVQFATCVRQAPPPRLELAPPKRQRWQRAQLMPPSGFPALISDSEPVSPCWASRTLMLELAHRAAGMLFVAWEHSSWTRLGPLHNY